MRMAMDWIRSVGSAAEAGVGACAEELRLVCRHWKEVTHAG